MESNHAVKSGIKSLDDTTGGLPANVFNIVETPDHQTGLLMLGHFLMAGLENGEKCTLVTQEDPLSLFQTFNACKMDFYKYLKSEQLVYLFYQPTVTTEIGLTNNYNRLMEELEGLSGKKPDRIALHQIDCLLNLHNHTLIDNCVQKLVASSRSTSATCLGQYTQFNNQVYRDVRISFLKSMPGFFTLENHGSIEHQFEILYRLSIDRVPWFHSGTEELLITLKKDEGFQPYLDRDNINAKSAA